MRRTANCATGCVKPPLPEGGPLGPRSGLGGRVDLGPRRPVRRRVRPLGDVDRLADDEAFVHLEHGDERVRIGAVEAERDLGGPGVPRPVEALDRERHARAGIRLARGDDARPPSDALPALDVLEDRVVGVDLGRLDLVPPDRGEVGLDRAPDPCIVHVEVASHEPIVHPVCAGFPHWVAQLNALPLSRLVLLAVA